MKKQILSVLLAISFVFTNMCLVYAEPQYLDAFQKINYDQLASSNGLVLNNAGYLSNGAANSYAVYNVDFTKEKATGMTVWMACHHFGVTYTGELHIKKGSTTGPVIAKFRTQNTGNWNTNTPIEPYYFDGTQCSGETQIYAVWTGTFGNLFGLQFKFTTYENVTAPSISLNGANLDDSTLVGAGATIERNSANNNNKTVNLILAQYDENGTMIGIDKSGEIVVGDYAPKNIVIDSAGDHFVDKKSATKSVGAFLWENDDSVVKKGEIIPATALSGTASTENIGVLVERRRVKISGSGAENIDVIIAVVPENYDETKPVYENSPIQLWETTVSQGKFYYEFDMSTTSPSDNYYVLVKGKTKDIEGNVISQVNLKKKFYYTSPDAIYSVLSNAKNPLNNSLDIVLADYDMFGVPNAQEALFTGLTADDKTLINGKIAESLADLPATADEISDFTPWLNGVKNAVIPIAVLKYAYNTKNVTNSEGYISEYSSLMGVADNDKYKTEFNQNKNAVTKILVNNLTSQTTVSDFARILKESVIVDKFNQASSWGYVDEVITSYATDIPLDLSVYRLLKNEVKSEMLNAFINKNFTDIDAIKTLFAESIAKYNSEENMVENVYDRKPVDTGDVEFVAELSREKKEEEPEKIIKAFTDLDGVEWARESINYMRSRGFVNGKSDTIFSPSDSITREEFVAILVRSFGISAGNAEAIVYADVDRNAWYAGYITSATQTGIVNGVGDNWFGVGQNITREQMATMLQRTAKALNKEIRYKTNAVAFTDYAYISDYAYDAVMELAKAKIVNGTGNERFSPKKNATRAEAVVMIYNMLQNLA